MNHFLFTYFDKISIVYHIIFLSFLIWIVKFKHNNTKVNSRFVTGLGLYVIGYGIIILLYGHELFNKSTNNFIR
jgi:hypothetical protein